jgi:fructokinase
MNYTKLNIVCFGEVLFDVFPKHSKIGGAPLNVALRLASFGVNSKIISKIGDDKIGKDALKFISDNGISVDSIQIDEIIKTGQVLVQLDSKGSATYSINYPSAWDKIEFTLSAKRALENTDALIFGSLACRDKISYKTLLELIKLAKYKVFDVNLRAPFYTKEILMDLMKQSDFIKFNEEELFEICEMLNSPFHSFDQNINFIANKTKTNQICVTKGSHGAVFYDNGKMYYTNGFKVKVKDTVGSGDSFLAALISNLLLGVDPQNAINFASAIGALVAKQEGANPKISQEDIENFMNPLGN